MNAKKVLYISYDSALEPIPQSQVIPYLRELSKKGYAFHWLSFDKRRSPDFKKKRQALRQDLLRHNITWHSLPYYRRPYLMAKLFNILCGIFVSSFYVVRYNISLIHCRSEVASVIGIAMKIIFRKKTIYDRRGFMAEDYVEGGMWKDRESFLYKLLIFIDNKLLLHSDKIVVLTNRMKEWLLVNRPWTKDKITVIPCCVDPSRFRLHGNGDKKAEIGLGGKFLFVYSGSLGTWYLLDHMIDFFRTAKEYIPNAHFLILTMSDHEIARDIIKSKNNSVEDFTIKSVDFDKVPIYLECADSSICFIKPVVSKLASSPTKLAECFASGIPVVINSNIGDCDEFIQTNRIGSIVKDFNDTEYRRSIKELMGLLERQDDLRESCFRFAKEYFALEKGVKRYNSIYSELI